MQTFSKIPDQNCTFPCFHFTARASRGSKLLQEKPQIYIEKYTTSDVKVFDIKVECRDTYFKYKDAISLYCINSLSINVRE
jgi:hypothetical protein